METLHLRATQHTMQLLMDSINKIAKDGNEVEILDNTLYEKEKEMIFNALIQEKSGQTFEHNDIWDELLK
ncbi:hypothetical protein FCU45_04705 [Sulfurimonas crateris]|uniref:Uncharacterized protein n=1 Tax=Sulfurimonas crateris TaxID=2574727 RepID=A0A4U2Z7R4_9BACT|nr:hypothetical protein [Sulfurimonas crateris]TKI69915.1 hypothetical protein FCU45_04705 [Sulfurimonas crateris]